MKIGIVGGGTVGRATARTYLEWADEVRVSDIIGERRTHSLLDTLDCDIIFLCLPTPQAKDSLACDISAVELCLAHIATLYPDANLVLRSTVPIGTTRRLSERYNLPNLIHSPEFLTARCAETDSKVPARNIVGYTGREGDEQGGLLWRLYQERFPGVPTYLMTSDESEAVKLFTNGFFAVKVAYFNEIRQLADKFDLNWGRVMGGVLSDGRITHHHTRVPGPDGKYGFGGSCLPKDLANLVSCIEGNSGYGDLSGKSAVTRAAYERNLSDRER